MEHVQPLTRIAYTSTGLGTVSILTTTQVGGVSTFQIAGMTSVEIANLSTTGAAAFTFTPAGLTTPTVAVAPGSGWPPTGNRVIPPDTVVTEILPQGASFVSAIGIGAANVQVTFTPVTP